MMIGLFMGNLKGWL